MNPASPTLSPSSGPRAPRAASPRPPLTSARFLQLKIIVGDSDKLRCPACCARRWSRSLYAPGGDRRGPRDAGVGDEGSKHGLLCVAALSEQLAVLDRGVGSTVAGRCSVLVLIANGTLSIFFWLRLRFPHAAWTHDQI